MMPGEDEVIGHLFQKAGKLLHRISTENFTEHLIITSAMAVMIASTLFTIIALDYQFTGEYPIEPDVFINILPPLISK